MEGLDVEVAEEGCADVDGQPVVGQAGGEQTVASWSGWRAAAAPATFAATMVAGAYP